MTKELIGDTCVRRSPPARSWTQAVVLVLGLAGTVGAGLFVERHYPVRHWLFWTLLQVWGWQALLTAGCWATGRVLLRRVFRCRELPALESAVMSMALGVVCFVMAMYIGGALALFGPTFAIALPAGMVALSFLDPPPVRQWFAEIGQPRWSMGLMSTLLLAAGACFLAVLYVHILTPDALCYDTQWTHLTIAEDFAREGRIVPLHTPWPKAVPHLASMLYTWAYTLPGLTTPVRWMVALHTELVLFLWTLAAIVAAVRWMNERFPGRYGLAWVAFLLFPSIVTYDSNLNAGADHAAAFFAIPMFLAVARCRDRFLALKCALAGVLIGAALITKWQCAYLVAALGCWFAASWSMSVARSLRTRTRASVQQAAITASPTLGWRPLLFGPAAAVAGILVAMSPYLLENLVYHHNPVYPFGLELFPASFPKQSDSAAIFTTILQSVDGADASLWVRLKKASEVLFTFSFVPHYSRVGGMPWFGFLFTLLSPLALIVGPARLRVALLVGTGALMAWGTAYLVDRNIQVFAPVLVAVTAAAIARVWQFGKLARLAIVSLVGFQMVWGADAFAFGPIESSLRLIRSGFEKRWQTRFDSHAWDRRAIDENLPKNAHLLLHNINLHLGMNRRTTLDWDGLQFLIDYRRLRTPREVFDRYRELGVTHLVWTSDYSQRKQTDIVFATLAHGFAEHGPRFGGLNVATMPAEPPPEERPYRVLSVGVWEYPDGLYPIEDMGIFELLPRQLRPNPKPEIPVSAEWPAHRLLATADVVVLSTSQHPEWLSSPEYAERFRLAISYNGFAIHIRRREVPQNPL